MNGGLQDLGGIAAVEQLEPLDVEPARRRRVDDDVRRRPWSRCAGHPVAARGDDG